MIRRPKDEGGGVSLSKLGGWGLIAFSAVTALGKKVGWEIPTEVAWGLAGAAAIGLRNVASRIFSKL